MSVVECILDLYALFWGRCLMLKAKNVIAGQFAYNHMSYTTNPESLSTRHIHDTYEILFVTAGEGRYLIEGREFRLSPRTLVLIKPFQYHCVEVDLSAGYERHVLHFPQSFVLKEIEPMLLRLTDSKDEESGLFFAPEMLTPAIVSLFDKFAETEALGEEEREIYCRLVLSELIILLCGQGKEKILRYGDEIGAKVARYINTYLDKNITLDEIASKFFLSKYYLCRMFKKYSGVSIHAYINHKRVMYAKQLIESGETASSAAYRVGFGDYSAFYRAYVKIVGRAPTSHERSFDEK